MLTPKIKFVNASKCTFYATVKKRVDAYFIVNECSIYANKAMWFKASLFLVGFFGIYALILFGGFSHFVTLVLAISLGVVGAFVGFNVCHDAIHKSFSSNNTVNQILGFMFHVLGANPYVWSITHNVIHHTYTNIAGHDEDIDVARGLIRFSDTEPVNWVQRYQHFYAFFLYSLSMVTWVFKKDFKKFFQPKIGMQTSNHPKIEYFNLFFFKLLYGVLFIVLPLLLLDITWWQFIIGFLSMQLAQGLVIGSVFQLAHVVEGTEFPLPNEVGNIEEAWAAHQMMTTANFGVDNKLTSFFCGGLNRQIEHHIFPKVCHIHYPAIGKILKETALEFNLPYIESPSFSTALASHYRTLRRLGREAYDKKSLSPIH